MTALPVQPSITSVKSEHETSPGVAPGLTFKYSVSTDQGVNTFFNRARTFGLIRLSSTLLNFWGDWTQGKKYDVQAYTIANVLGFWANISYFFFGHSKNPILGNLAVTSGEWTRNGHHYEQHIPGLLPDESIQHIHHMITDSAYPTNAIICKNDPKTNTSTIRIRSDVFDMIQSEMREELNLRHEALKVLDDSTRHMRSQDALGANSVSAIALEGVNDDVVRETLKIVRDEWQVRARISGMNGKDRSLEVHPMYTPEFAERISFLSDKSRNTLLVKRDTRQTHAPSVVEMIFCPHRYPMEHGTMVGGMFGNALRMTGAVQMTKRNDTGEKRTKEVVSNFMSMLSYIMEIQPETPSSVRGKWEETGNEQVLFSKDSHSYRDDFLTFSRERPMAMGSIIRTFSTGLKGYEQYNNFMREGAMVGSWQRLAATVLDGANIVYGATIKKADFGK